MAGAENIGDFNWTVQIGPGLQGMTQGVVNGNSATFYVAPSGITGEVYAACSTDAGNSWTVIPPNEPFSVSGSNFVQWQVDAGQENDAKFLIGNVA